MEAGKSVAQAVATGKVLIGTRKSIKAIKRGQAKLVIAASNCPRETLGDIRHYTKLAGVPFRAFESDSATLGLACGKPFSVNVLVVLDPGSSNILGVEGRR